MTGYVLIGIGVIVLILVFWFIGGYNSLISLKTKVDEAFATIDVYLKKRYDLIPNIVETVKGYAKHEEGTLTKVIEARSKSLAAPLAEKGKYEGELTNALKGLLALSEAYPDLKADRQFTELSRVLEQTETDLAQSRKYYNAVVRLFNTKIQTIPTNFVAGMMHLSAAPYFTVDNDEERKAVKVQF